MTQHHTASVLSPAGHQHLAANKADQHASTGRGHLVSEHDLQRGAEAAQSAKAQPKRRVGGPGKPVWFDGKVYPSQAELARAKGLGRATVNQAIKADRLKFLGMGSTHKGRAIIAQASRCQPVAAHGWRWHSQKDAAAALGRSPAVICAALQAGRFEALVYRILGSKT